MGGAGLGEATGHLLQGDEVVGEGGINVAKVRVLQGLDRHRRGQGWQEDMAAVVRGHFASLSGGVGDRHPAEGDIDAIGEFAAREAQSLAFAQIEEAEDLQRLHQATFGDAREGVEALAQDFEDMGGLDAHGILK